MEKYTVDRFEGDIVVLLKKGDESLQRDEPKGNFPGNISKGDIVEEVETKEGTGFRILEEETKMRKNQAEGLLNKLKKENEK